MVGSGSEIGTHFESLSWVLGTQFLHPSLLHPKFCVSGTLRVKSQYQALTPGALRMHIGVTTHILTDRQSTYPWLNAVLLNIYIMNSVQLSGPVLLLSSASYVILKIPLCYFICKCSSMSQRKRCFNKITILLACAKNGVIICNIE